jgi:hypothetical protein
MACLYLIEQGSGAHQTGKPPAGKEVRKGIEDSFPTTVTQCCIAQRMDIRIDHKRTPPFSTMYFTVRV